MSSRMSSRGEEYDRGETSWPLLSVFHGIIGPVEERGHGTLRDAYFKNIVDKKKEIPEHIR